jgi:hypothetical protein
MEAPVSRLSSTIGLAVALLAAAPSRADEVDAGRLALGVVVTSAGTPIAVGGAVSLGVFGFLALDFTANAPTPANDLEAALNEDVNNRLLLGCLAGAAGLVVGGAIAGVGSYLVATSIENTASE